MTSIALAACTGRGMTRSKASELLHDTLQRDSATSCSWSVVEAGRDGGPSTFIDAVDTTQHDCARELEAAGILEIGACLDPPPPGGPSCLYRELKPRGPAALTKDSLVFSCGTFSGAEIESMETDADGAVTVHYARVFEDAPLLHGLVHCGLPTLRRPDAGRRDKKLTYRRSGDGRWEPFMGEAGNAWLR